MCYRLKFFDVINDDLSRMLHWWPTTVVTYTVIIYPSRRYQLFWYFHAPRTPFVTVSLRHDPARAHNTTRSTRVTVRCLQFPLIRILRWLLRHLIGFLVNVVLINSRFSDRIVSMRVSVSVPLVSGMLRRSNKEEDAGS